MSECQSGDPDPVHLDGESTEQYEDRSGGKFCANGGCGDHCVFTLDSSMMSRLKRTNVNVMLILVPIGGSGDCCVR